MTLHKSEYVTLEINVKLKIISIAGNVGLLHIKSIGLKQKLFGNSSGYY